MTCFDERQDFEEIEFEGLDGRSTTVQDKEFHECRFMKCKFLDASFVRCKFIDCRFEDCDLSNLTVRNCVFRKVHFKNTKAIGINWTAAEVIAHAHFISCQLNFCNFIGLDLRRSQIENCIVREADFADGNLTEAICKGSDFSGTRFANTNLSKADFRSAINYTIRANENKIAKAKFSLPEATALLYGLDIILD